MSSPLVPDAPICSALGCTNPATVAIDHPEYGERVVCEPHQQDHEVICHV